MISHPPPLTRLHLLKLLLQGIEQKTYALKSNVHLFKDLNRLAKEEAFRNASIVHPVTDTDDFYRLHAYFSKVSTAATYPLKS